MASCTTVRFSHKIAVTVVCAICCLALVLCGCDTQQQDNSKGKQSRTFVDSVNRTVQLPVEKLERVAVTNESGQEMLLTLAPDTLVGLASAMSDQQAAIIGNEYAELPVYGELDGNDAVFNKELLDSLKPQVIVDVQPTTDDCSAQMEKLQKQTGIPCVHIGAQLDSLDRTYSALGDLLSCSEKARELGTYCRDTYYEYRQIANATPESDRPRVAYMLSHDGDKTMPQGSVQAAAIDTVCNNTMKLDASNVSDEGKQTSSEQAALWDPDIVLFASAKAYESLPQSNVWKNMTAIKKKRYYRVPSLPYNWLSSPVGPNQLLGMQWLTYICYGKDADINLRSAVTKGFKTLYGYKLGKDEYKAMMEDALPANEN